MSRWQEKRAREAEYQLEKDLAAKGNGVDLEGMVAKDTRGAAMGDGDEELYEKKLSKDEKKALAKAKREAKKKAAKGSKKEEEEAEEEKKEETRADIPQVNLTTKEQKRQALLDDLSKNDIVVTYESKRGALHANTRDINVGGVTVSFHGKHLIEETELVINYGNRYGFIGPNGSGKVRSIVVYTFLYCCVVARNVSFAHFPFPLLTSHTVHDYAGNCSSCHSHS